MGGIVRRNAWQAGGKECAQDPGSLEIPEGPADHLDAAGGDGVADGARIALGVHERIRAPQLPEAVDVAVADHRLPVPRRPSLRPEVEVDTAQEHRVAFDGVEQVGVTFELAPEARPVREERVRRDDQSRLTAPQRPKVVERANKVGTTPEIQQQDVPPFDGPFDPRNERDAALARVVEMRAQIELTVVERDGQGVKFVRCRVVYELPRRMRNPVERIVCRMGMEFDFEHVRT